MTDRAVARFHLHLRSGDDAYHSTNRCGYNFCALDAQWRLL